MRGWGLEFWFSSHLYFLVFKFGHAQSHWWFGRQDYVWEMCIICLCMCSQVLTYVKVRSRHQVSSSLIYFLRQCLFVRVLYSGCLLTEKPRIWELSSSRDRMSQQAQLGARVPGSPRELLVFSLHWNSEEVGFNTSKSMSGEQNRWNCLPEWEKVDKKSNASFFCIPLCGLLPGVAQI